MLVCSLKQFAVFHLTHQYSIPSLRHHNSPVVTRGPGQRGLEGGGEVEHGPGEYDVVVGAEEEGDDDGPHPRPLQDRTELVQGPDGPPPGVLPHGELHEQERNPRADTSYHHSNPIDCHSPAEEEHDEVGDEEGPAAGLVGVVGEPPDVSQSNSVADTGKEEGDSGAPGLPLFLNSHPDNVQFMYSFRQWFVCSIVV